ncbi:MAG TPA: polysaccharide deacetylase family protein [Pyrinomonadaceae bacterium]|nr:polysaccharide deacetylase family protein [Pyrinomonadaceae bacterium]
MNRRTFTKTLGLSVAALGVRGVAGVPAFACKRATLYSITMDDFYWTNAVKLTATQRNEAILGTLRDHSHQAALFVIGRNIDSAEGKELLTPWDSSGHLIGNHTYSHRPYDAPEANVAEYQKDILRAEALLKEFPRFKKYFRFPMLKEGETVEKRDAMRLFFAEHGYRNGHVTIDNSDWAIDQRLTARLKKDPAADVKPYRDFYLEHMWARAEYYDKLARSVVGRPINHTVLMHFNLLNGLFLGDLIEMFKRRNWQLINAEEAFTDRVFASNPKVVPAGESLVWSLAKEKRKIAKSLRYPAEDAMYEKARMDKLGL